MMQILNKNEQEELCWNWQLNPNLQLIYYTFADYVEAKEKEKIKENK